MTQPKTEVKVETDGINSHHNIADPVDFRIDGIVDINGERNLDSTFFERINNNSNIESNENPLNAYRCSANETVLLNTSSENEFISIAPGENVIPESLLDDKFCEELSHPLLFPTGKTAFNFTLDDPPIHALLITILILVCLHGKLTLT